MTGDQLVAQSVLPLVRGRFGTPWLWRESCSSTQDLLRGSGLPEGAVAVTEHQTRGRGRSGRRWDAQPGSSVLVSVLLRPPTSSRLPQLALVAGLAVARSIETLTGLDAPLKWPNDVLLDGRKAAGVLVEGDDDAVVCGIGINVRQTAAELPSDTRRPATSLRIASGDAPDRALLLATLLDALEAGYDVWRHDGLESLLPELERRNALAGRRARVGHVVGTVGSIAADGRLTVVDELGAIRLVASGEIEPL